MKRKNKKTRGGFVDFFADLIIRIGKWLIKIIIELTVGAIYGTYTVLERVYDLLCVIYCKLPKVAKMGLFYIILGVIIFLSLNVKVIYQAVKVEVEKEVVSYVSIEDKTCKMDKISCEIYIVGKAYGLSEEQSLLAVAISRWETGNFTSSAFKNKNNFGGNMKNGELASFDTFENGLNYFIKNLKEYYFDMGLNTVAEIQTKYCPVGAANDPKGLNANWLTGVTNLFNNLKGGE